MCGRTRSVAPFLMSVTDTHRKRERLLLESLRVFICLVDHEVPSPELAQAYDLIQKRINQLEM